MEKNMFSMFVKMLKKWTNLYQNWFNICCSYHLCKSKFHQFPSFPFLVPPPSLLLESGNEIYIILLSHGASTLPVCDWL